MSFNEHVITVFITQCHQWYFDILKPQWVALKVLLRVPIIDDDLAGAFLQNDPSDGAFPAAGAEDRLGGEPAGEPGLDVLPEVRGLGLRRSGGGGGGGGGGYGERGGSGGERDGEGLGAREGEGVGLGRDLGGEGEGGEGGGEGGHGQRHYLLVSATELGVSG